MYANPSRVKSKREIFSLQRRWYVTYTYRRMAKTDVQSIAETDVPRETSDPEPPSTDVPRGTSGQFQPGRQKTGGRRRQDRAPDTGDVSDETFFDQLGAISPEEWRQIYSLY